MRKAKYAKFHSGLFVPGVGTVGDTLPSSTKNFPLSMEWGIDGLYITIKGVYVVVPSASVFMVVLEAPEAAATPKVTPKAS